MKTINKETQTNVTKVIMAPNPNETSFYFELDVVYPKIKEYKVFIPKINEVMTVMSSSLKECKKRKRRNMQICIQNETLK